MSALDRRGFSAPEALVALLLGLFIVHLGFTTLARLRTIETRLSARADRLVAMRVARHVLRRELRHGTPGRDWHTDGDSLSLRAFRGTGLVCSVDSTGIDVVVSYRGDRTPDPTKDSLLLIGPTGDAQGRALVGVSAAGAGCGAASPGTLQRWSLDMPIGPGPVLARLFERGSYHLTGSALRYRRGASGRQPLTPEVWASTTAWRSAPGLLGLDVEPRDRDSAPAWSAFLAATEVP